MSDALWCGCPGLALRGETFAARVSASIAMAAGLTELVVNSLAAYEAAAYAIATEPQRLAQLRERVTRAREDSPLFDSGAFTRDLEALYAELVLHHRAGSGAA
jgi:predicted O-linked N-acetylglucosamine transferase (SPINDLY family)